MGMIDYKSVIVILIYLFIILKVLSFINVNNEMKLYIILFSLLPIVAIFSVNYDGDTAIHMLYIIIKFFASKKLFIQDNNLTKNKKYSYKYYINFKN